MNCAYHYFKAFSLSVAASLALITTYCQAQFTASDWVVTSIDFSGGIAPGSQVTDLSATGFRYVAEATDRHNIAQKLSTPIDLLVPGDKVTLEFDVVFNQTPDPSGHGGNNFRYTLFDTSQTSDYVSFGATNTGGSGGEGLHFTNRNKLNGQGDESGKEQTVSVGTEINEAAGFLGRTPNNRWDAQVMRGNTGSEFPAAHVLGNDLGDTHRMQINVTMLHDGLFLYEGVHANLTQGTSTADGFTDRLFDRLWRDGSDDTLSFDGMALTVNESGTAGSQIDFTVSDLSLTKTNIGTPGVDSNGTFHVDFVGRTLESNYNTNCGNCWLGRGEDFTWAPFILEGDLDDPFGGFTNPTLTYDDAFGTGNDATISTDFPKVTHGNFTAPSDVRMAANFLALTAGNTGSVTLSLPAGEYEVTTYHYVNTAGDVNTADRVVTDAGGTSSTVSVTATNEDPVDGDFTADNAVAGADVLAWQRGESPSALSPADLADWQANYGTGVQLFGETFAITSDGVNDVEIAFTNTGTGDFPLNGIILDQLPPPAAAAVPEPTTFALAFMLVLSEACIRRKPNKDAVRRRV